VTPLGEAIGYTAGTLTTIAFVPQVMKSWRSKSVDDLSFVMLATFTTGVTLWLIYGIMIASAPVILANSVTVALNTVLVALKLRYGRRR
jgi:MtN3 and saliva related transmembrane protein